MRHNRPRADARLRRTGSRSCLRLGRSDVTRLLGSFVSKEQPSAIDDPTIKNGFYGAPTVCAVFAPKNFLFSVADAFCAAENMVLEATELGVSSCIISRGEETFSGEEGEAMLRDWNVPRRFYRPLLCHPRLL